jgi:hypothetical protein
MIASDGSDLRCQAGSKHRWRQQKAPQLPRDEHLFDQREAGPAKILGHGEAEQTLFSKAAPSLAIVMLTGKIKLVKPRNGKLAAKIAAIESMICC